MVKILFLNGALSFFFDKVRNLHEVRTKIRNGFLDLDVTLARYST